MLAIKAAPAKETPPLGSAPQAMQHYMRPGLLQLAELPPLSLYIHIPWCLRKCPYCDFNSHEIHRARRADHSSLPTDRYLSALLADLEATLPLIWGRSICSIFIGGGTPSLLPPEAVDRLLADVRARLRLLPDCEITLEANPGTFEKERFRAYQSAGITRLSIGVQSFNNQHLHTIGRVHNRAQALAAAEEAAAAFDTFNLDLMYALPGQTLAELEQDLRTALALEPPHLSIYHLTIEANTWFAKHPPPQPEEDTAWAMLDSITQRAQQHGLQRYEVSAWARPGHQCLHNTNYWQFGDYLGIGAGAHSKLSFAHRIVRQVRLRDPQRYMQGALAGKPLAQDTPVAHADLPFEYMLNALRLRQGFALHDFTARTGLPLTAIAQGLEQAEQRGLITRSLAHVQPTERGFDFLSDLQALFLDDSE